VSYVCFLKTTSLSMEKIHISTVKKAIKEVNKFFKKNTLFYLAVLVLVIGITSCSSDDPIPVEPTNQAPTLVVNTLNVNDADNTISFNADGTDSDGTITNYSAFLTKVDGSTENLTINNTGLTNQEVTAYGQYNKLTVSVTDNDGATTKVEKPINLTVENITISYVAETEITANSINEETSGKIASLSTTVNKIVNTDGNEVTTPISGGTIIYTITGADASFLEIIGNEVHVKMDIGKDVEDVNGADVDANKLYDFGIETNVTGLENGNSANDTDTAEDTPNPENIDIDDFAPFSGLVVEHNGDIRPEYTGTVAQANSLFYNLAERTGVALLDRISDVTGSDFTRTRFTIAGLHISYLTYQGQRIDGRSVSRILDAIYKARDASQTAYVTYMILDNDDLANNIAIGLQNVNFTTYVTPSDPNVFDAGAQIEITAEESAKIGAAAIVAKNKIDGLY
jgi:hypothetical protein